ncbi:sensor histidine kinase [Draconibacterium sp. IB214405]|uniref:sensor histidine kinase n=1 Tax=Draconibacterium sp. IB214405 TaxID=3097352 RepID=UPI002A144EB9|nr:sensor histidine kinase [Draconibacterium sp. IB214405]MDX8341384.1 sensor histidine kinase [Draconibacterium sp. IB214405]
MNRRILKLFFRIFLPLFVLFSGVVFTIKEVQNNSEKLISLTSERSEIDMKSEIIHRDLNFIIGDLQIMATLNVFIDVWQNPDNENTRAVISTVFKKVSRERQLYDQIRLIDLNGDELIRVNLHDGEPVLVEAKDLQTKKERPYFPNTLKLGQGAVYVSPFDLNIENKQIEIPFKPILRFATPMFDANGEKTGILVFNYLGAYMLKNSEAVGNHRFTEHFMLLNKDSYWLKAPDAALEWGFMFDDKKEVNFQHYYPDEWEIVSSESSGQFENEKGLFTFNTIYPLENNESTLIWTEEEAYKATKDYFWKAVSFVPREELYEAQNERNVQLLVVYLLLVILSGIGAWVLARSINRRELAEEKIRKNLVKLQDLNATKDRFFSIIAHDLRSPFNTMLGFGEMLKEEVDNENTEHIKEYTHYLYSGILKTYNLLNELLDWANLQRRKVAFEPKTIDAERCVDEILQILELSTLNKKQTLVKLIPEKTELVADRNMFCTIVRNLLNNAIKFTPEGGTITFKAKFSNGKHIFTVADTGVGISHENLKKLFKVDESFSTAGTNEETGTGLGLVLCKELVEKHGGEIWAESEKGKGAEFHFTIPLP